MHRYRNGDYWRIRTFLRDLLLINDRVQASWEVARFDYWRWHGILNMNDGTLEDDVFIWQTSEGNIAAVLNREAPGSVFLQIYPDFYSDELVADMLAVAEEHLTRPLSNDRRALHVWAESEDIMLRKTLSDQGYSIADHKKPEHQRRRFLNKSITPLGVADGYTIRSMGDVDEHSARCWVSWQAFHPTEPDDDFEDGWYHNIQRAPLYRRDLDLVAVAPDGTLAAFCTIWYDDVTRTGLFEPVGTAPQHQQRGLGKSMLTEGLIRLQRMGTDLAYVGSYTPPAHALYESAGFKTYRILEPWMKERSR
jgi:ribosomal protein S18 acetylase RimI-like enzyme